MTGIKSSEEIRRFTIESPRPIWTTSGARSPRRAGPMSSRRQVGYGVPMGFVGRSPTVGHGV